MHHIINEHVYRIRLAIADRRRLNLAAHARRCSNTELLQRIVSTVLREGLIDAVIDDDPVRAAFAPPPKPESVL